MTGGSTSTLSLAAVAERIHAVRVLITTRKTFSAANLARDLLAEAS